MHRERSERTGIGARVAAALLAAQAAWACGGTEGPRAPRNVVLVTIDTLRADRLSCYGYERETSPNLDRFGAQGVRFANAFSTSSFTPPAHASLLTSQYVAEHGLLTWNPLDEAKLTLPEVLSDLGYRTGASVNLKLLSDQNLGQGFGWTNEGLRPGPRIVADGLRFLREDDPRPFFLWLHLYDVHRPYGGPPEWQAHFGQPSRPGIGDTEEHYRLLPEQIVERGLSDADLRWISDRYDAGIAYVDTVLEPLLAELETPARRADTLVVITADHGEALLEHPARLFTHDPFLYPVVTHIPLLLRLPGEGPTGRTVDELVSLIDLAPTVLHVLGLPPPPSFRGASLLPLLAGGTLQREEVYMECWGMETLKAARSVDDLVVVDVTRQQAEFFELGDRFGASTPKPRSQSGLALYSRLQAFAQRLGAVASPPELSAEVQEELRRLGYL